MNTTEYGCIPYHFTKMNKTLPHLKNVQCHLCLKNFADNTLKMPG